MNTGIDEFIDFVRGKFGTNDFIPLHAPVFQGNEEKYVVDCIKSTFVSSVGKFVDQFEQEIVNYTGAKYAIATVNGTAALHVALRLVGVEHDNEVITQPLTFIATLNAISYLSAHPVFVDVDKETMGMSPESLETFLNKNTEYKSGSLRNKNTGRKIKAVVPMHTFGNPLYINEIAEICNKYGLALVEDSAESLGSFVGTKHTGTYGACGVLSFNGNKTITTGGGGMIITDDEKLAKLAKHMTTTAKLPHQWEYTHDMVGYNYRLPNINSALGCAQMESLPSLLHKKRMLAHEYKSFFKNSRVGFLEEREGCRSNYWLNAIVLASDEERNNFLKQTNDKGVMTRPIWRLMNKLEMFKNAEHMPLPNSEWLEARVVNIPSSAPEV